MSILSKTTIPIALSLLSACASHPHHYHSSYYPAYRGYQRSYVVERNYYPQPAYGNHYYRHHRPTYNWGGYNHHEHHDGDHHSSPRPDRHHDSDGHHDDYRHSYQQRKGRD